MTSDPRFDPALAAGNRKPRAGCAATHLRRQCGGAGVATITLDRPERETPPGFDAYAGLHELFGPQKEQLR